jgi:hypothetical protein
MYCILIALFIPAICNAWNGVLVDSTVAGGGSQIVTPKSHTVIANVNLGLPHVQSTTVIQLNGLVYIIGGINGTDVIATVKIFNPTTNTSTNGPNLVTPRQALATTEVNNTILVCGGYDGTAPVATCERSNVGMC